MTTESPRRRHQGRTLEAAFDGPDNALNAIRLLLALVVIFGHAVPLGGFAPATAGPFVHGGLHGHAVEAFFVISGYLIFASGMRTATLGYLWRRLLRIYPAWLVAITATAFVAAPIGALLEDGASWEWRSAVGYVIGALDLKPSQDGIMSTLLTVPSPETWNGSLWTLFYESAAYIGVALLCAWSPLRARLGAVIPPAAGALTVAWIALPPGVVAGLVPGAVGDIAENGLRLWTFFAWGMVAYIYRDRLRATSSMAIASGIVFLLTAHFAGLPHGLFVFLLLPSLSIAVLSAGVLLPWRVGNSTDLSYGLYVYAFPVQQILVLLGVTEFGWAVTALSCVAVTVPLAWMSWQSVEQPALRMKHVVPSSRRRNPASSSRPQERQ